MITVVLLIFMVNLIISLNQISLFFLNFNWILLIFIAFNISKARILMKTFNSARNHCYHCYEYYNHINQFHSLTIILQSSPACSPLSWLIIPSPHPFPFSLFLLSLKKYFLIILISMFLFALCFFFFTTAILAFEQWISILPLIRYTVTHLFRFLFNFICYKS